MASCACVCLCVCKVALYMVGGECVWASECMCVCMCVHLCARVCVKNVCVWECVGVRYAWVCECMCVHYVRPTFSPEHKETVSFNLKNINKSFQLLSF